MLALRDGWQAEKQREKTVGLQEEVSKSQGEISRRTEEVKKELAEAEPAVEEAKQAVQVRCPFKISELGRSFCVGGCVRESMSGCSMRCAEGA